MYFQDEARFGLKTVVGYCLSAIGVRPKAKYQHKFANTYLWGSYSPVNGDSFVWEIKRFKNKQFDNIELLKKWLHEMVCNMDKDLIKSKTVLVCSDRGPKL